MSWRILKCGAYLSLLLAGPAAAQTFFEEVTGPAFAGQSVQARGAAFGDYDNDGWPDLFMAENHTASNRVVLWHNDGNSRFFDQTAAIQTELSPKFKGGGSIFGDYDNDGDLDLFVPVGTVRGGHADRNALLRNDRGVFRDVALEAGLTDRLPTDSAIWLDYDRDGYLDLYTGNLQWAPPDSTVRNKLYRNKGDGTFADVTARAGLDMPFHPESGGSNGGMAAGDFNDDGWPDLYLGVFDDRNRLFLNDGKGGFQDATTAEVGDMGEAWGVTVGDIDNDGDLEVFQAAGGGQEEALPFRSLMLLNLGKGQFLDVLEGVGLTGVGAANVLGAGLADIDNDGDLDLVIGEPRFLFLNNGDGTFTDKTAQSGSSVGAWTMAFGDYDLDGFLDMLGGLAVHLDHNNGNANHYLRVELVGVESNRNGIGARVIATSGDLRQMREVLGGLGIYQDELVAHFGLGQHTQVDRLEVRWPSGQVDVLTDIPADQKIRVIEGQGGYSAVHPFRARLDTLVAGSTSTFKATVAPALFEKDAQVTQVVADLSSLGGPAAIPLVESAADVYRLEYPLAVGQNGLRPITFSIDQQTSLGPYWSQLSRQIAVLPAADLLVFDEGLSPGWQEEHHRTVEIADLTQTGEVHTGPVAGFFQVRESFGGWNLTLRPAAPVEPFGYRLRFAIRPGELTLPGNARFAVTLSPGRAISLLDSAWMDVNRQEWQVVEIPLDTFDVARPIESIIFSGNFGGTFYLDDIRLVAATPPPATVVEEERTTALPQSFALSQNFPNPFNSETVIRFALPDKGEVELVVYNLAGQQVVRLAEGVREAGGYTVRWDGRDERGRELASGIYLYRLRAGERMETRKLALVR